MPKNCGKKKPINTKNFGQDIPWRVSCLSHGHVPSVPSYVPSVPRTFCPLNLIVPHKSAQTSRASLGRSEFVPGTLPGLPTTKFLYVIFFIGVLLHKNLLNTKTLFFVGFITSNVRLLQNKTGPKADTIWGAP